ncbi:sorting nexin-17-like [Anneissia japonica]|uniref:sorting nexin-17-like n=1 Tax=Anneissia japonica TaxID=1529436 RepID=UPI001425ACAF|nr:sorting nexin-17-like [Anneissia japonica]
MHFSIPDTEEFTSENGSTYTGYHLHVNGVEHSTLRYSQLHDFNEKLKKEFGSEVINHFKFPPKKLLGLNPAQKEERREKLEHYIQLLSQDARVANSDVFNGFLISAQKETEKGIPESVELNVYLMNGHKITVDIMSTDQAEDVLEAVASKIELPDQFVYYFGLYLVKKDESTAGSIVRKIHDFESPYISLSSSKGPHRIVVRKSYWDPVFDDDLKEDRVAMNLLFIQAVSDVDRGWVSANKEQLRHLDSLKKKNLRKEYLQEVRRMKYYNYIQFKPCTADYPEENVPVTVHGGNREIIFRVRTADGSFKEGTFKITRMRCWRITSSQEGNSDALELSFEYLMAKDTLQWITVRTPEAILMSLSLQGMVDELIMCKKGLKMKKPSDRIKGPQRQYKGRDGGIIITRSTTNNAAAIPDPPVSQKGPENSANHNKNSDKMQSTLPPKSKGPAAHIENEIFEGIGDDDL